MKIDTKKLQDAKDVRNIHVPIQVQDFFIQLLQWNALRTDYFKTCLSCKHFNEDNEGCALANGLRPPARVIANACKEWKDKIDDDIPF
jgi:hypothetical protein